MKIKNRNIFTLVTCG